MQRLPPDSAAHRADVESQGWTVTDYLLASLVNATRQHVAVTVAANSEGGYEAPDLVETPAQIAERERAEESENSNIAAAQAWFAQQIDDE